MKSFAQAEIIKNTEYTYGIYEMILFAPEIAKEAKPGQFINIYTGQDSMLLPRPISICGIDTEKGHIRLLYQLAGKGTKFFSTLKSGTLLNTIGPLGNGFTLSEGSKHMIVGGGIGVPPLLELAKHLKGTIQVFIGAKSAPILAEEFQALGAEVFTASDDGSCGFHGNVLELIQKINPVPDSIYACGPKIMLRAVSLWAKSHDINIQVSMEERMACGLGACVGCAVKIKKSGESEWQNLKVCKDGPVFLGNEVAWDE